jgi:hypothetical protein
MNPRDGGRRTAPMMILLLLVTIPVILGFLLPGTTETRLVAVDLRAAVTSETLPKELLGESPSDDLVIVVVNTTKFEINSCPPGNRPYSVYCDINSDKPVAIVPNDDKNLPELLETLYGSAATGSQHNAVWQGTLTISSRFGWLTAALSFAILGALGTLLYSAQLRRSRRREPAAVQPTRYQPRRQMAEASARPGPPPHRQAVSAVQSAPAGGEITAELRSLAAKARGKAVARTHITARGGYITVGDVVVWATLRPSGEAVVEPDDLVEVLGVDEETEALVVAPAGTTSTERGLRP